MNELLFRFVDESLSVEQQNVLWPKRQTVYASGFDLVAANLEPVILAPLGRALLPTGVAICLDEGFEAQVRSRSGLALKNGISILNAPGTIDADYRGEIKVVLINHGQEHFEVTFGMRIAQLVIAKVAMVCLKNVASLTPSQRGAQGFGSTGVL